MARSSEGRVQYPDLLRVFATFAVVVLHIAGSQMAVVAVSSSAWGVFNIWNGLVRWCVPVFVMLSGMFLLDPDHDLPLTKLLFRNGLRILTALLFWGSVYALADLAFWEEPFTVHRVLEVLQNAWKGNTHYHLWFLYMILGLYLVTPILRAFVRGADRQDFHWFFLVTFLVTSLLPVLFHLWPNATEWMQIWYNHLSIRAVLGYTGFYVAGYYLKTYPLGRPVRLLLYLLGIGSTVITIWGTRWASGMIKTLDDVFYQYFSPTVVCAAVALVVLFRYLPGYNKKDHPLMGKLAELSFAVYLVHDLFIMLLRKLEVTTLSFHPAASVPVLAVAVFLCSVPAAWLIRKIPGLRRWIS